MVETPAADLSIPALSGPANTSQGSSVTVSNSLKNQGTLKAENFYVGYYLSTDAAITTNDIRVAQRFINSLPARTIFFNNTTFTIPANLAPGTYYWGAIADDTQIISESNETNNNLAGNTIIVRAPNMMTTVSHKIGLIFKQNK